MRPVVLLLAAAALATGQSWETEQVDSTGWGYGVQMRRHPDGRLFLCYEDSATGQVRLACKGDTWQREDVPQPVPAAAGEPRFAFAPDGGVGVTYSGRSRAWLSRRTDTAWVHTPLPESANIEMRTLPMAFDSAGRPVLAVNFDPYGSGGWVMALGLLRRVDTTWVFTDTLDLGPRGPSYDVAGFGNREGSGLWGTYTTFVYDVGYWYMDIRWFEWHNGWQTGIWFGGERADVGGDGGAVDRHGNVHASFAGSDTTGQSGHFFDYDAIGGNEPEASALAIDTLDRPLVAYVLGGALEFCYRDNRGWHFFDVGASDVMSLDILAEPDGEPLIAYATSDGVFLARGLNVTGLDGQTPNGDVRPPDRTATIIRGVLFLPRSTSTSSSTSRLLDITGRRVADLKPGANDISRLAPGVYFARQTSGVTKVVRTR
jgi:hypothetical protein